MNHVRGAGFSLVEVVVAVGVFVAGVVGAIALLSTTTESAGATRQAMAATRVGESATAILRTLSWTQAQAWLAENDPPVIYATRSGDHIGWRDPVDLADAFFELTLSRNTDLSPVANDDTAGFLAMRLTLTWPVRQTEGDLVPLANREMLTFNTAVRR
ncbi:hypothetical protein [Synoicihabitans lomoniglobus]|uniref:Prepilin-type N-terminal cleavage/methylation domain-containing protein n=1 Tax=Synoicihabitans lomoniglobus TaxID=2909285 RepID=A0AAF0CSD0_9BACT|nr:hypothetical protein [Opitutaceae bacterium LMO-M01]WED67116.1 hypothetical protein PXH66_09660 [Opitutaceae bacterium LMO-M01]